MIWIYPSLWGKAFPTFIDLPEEKKISNSFQFMVLPTHPPYLGIEGATADAVVQVDIPDHIKSRQLILPPSIPPTGNLNHQRSPNNDSRCGPDHDNSWIFTAKKKVGDFFFRMSLLKKKTKDAYLRLCKLQKQKHKVI